MVVGGVKHKHNSSVVLSFTQMGCVAVNGLEAQTVGRGEEGENRHRYSVNITMHR